MPSSGPNVRRGDRPTTLRDIANLAGVHVSVVSKVLTGSASLRVRQETRNRIHEAAEQLNYRPNVAARALRLSSTGTVGMLVPSLRNPVYAEIIRGAFDRAWERDFVVLLAEDRGGGMAEEAYQRLSQAGRIDGLLASGVRPDSSLILETAVHFPVVFVNRRARDRLSISMEEEAAAVLAVTHLRELGHDRIAHLAGPEGIDTAERRVAGYKLAIEACCRPEIVHAGFDEPSGCAAMRHLMSLAERPTGVFVSNINQAIGALAGARQLQLGVPADVSVITYDDDPIGNYMSPPLTAIRMPLHELGRSAIDVLLDGSEEGNLDIRVATPPQLVVRESTGPPPR